MIKGAHLSVACTSDWGLFDFVDPPSVADPAGFCDVTSSDEVGTVLGNGGSSYKRGLIR